MTSTPKSETPLRRRKPKLDPQLAGEIEIARAALAEIADDDQVGEHVGAAADDDRLVTHRFVCLLPGYKGWHWFSTVARASRSKQVTVCELGLVSGDDSLLAPPWVPWSERVSEEERKQEQAEQSEQDGAEDTEQAAEEKQENSSPDED
ncbi:DUF3027 domain-containing protein [Micrococcoides hystricis]|uniref:DUF3027 domain-containing protein n=1 Tax=Micrococcoides hystricis TaxID=1572761 RepID=A0ABV6P9P0_9MICC